MDKQLSLHYILKKHISFLTTIFFFFIAEGLSDFHWKAKKEKSIEMGERNLLSSGYSTVAS